MAHVAQLRMMENRAAMPGLASSRNKVKVRTCAEKALDALKKVIIRPSR